MSISASSARVARAGIFSLSGLLGIGDVDAAAALLAKGVSGRLTGDPTGVRASSSVHQKIIALTMSAATRSAVFIASTPDQALGVR